MGDPKTVTANDLMYACGCPTPYGASIQSTTSGPCSHPEKHGHRASIVWEIANVPSVKSERPTLPQITKTWRFRPQLAWCSLGHLGVTWKWCKITYPDGSEAMAYAGRHLRPVRLFGRRWSSRNPRWKAAR